MALTAKQQRFVEEYMIDLNATQAAIRAGYSEQTAGIIGFENLKKPNIADEIERRRQKLGSAAEITAEWVLEQLVNNHNLAIKHGELPASNKALELIGKHKGMFKDKVELSGAVETKVNHNLKKLSREELAQLEAIVKKSSEFGAGSES